MIYFRNLPPKINFRKKQLSIYRSADMKNTVTL